MQEHKVAVDQESNEGEACGRNGLRKPLCVVLVVDDLGYGGAERQVVELANNMDPERFGVHVCTLSEHIPLASRLTNAPQRLHVIPGRGRFDVRVIPRLARLLRSLKADIVHGYLFRAEIVSRLAGRMAGVKLVVGSERNANQTFGWSDILAYRLTQSCADAIIANSFAGAQSNAKVFRRALSHYRVVHNGVDARRFEVVDGTAFRESLGIPPSCPVVGAFANFKPQKNHAMLFRAFRLVLDSFRDARLLLVGDQPVDTRGRLDDYRARLDHLVDELQIRPHCIFLGHRDDVEHLYPACDVTVLASLHEGTPNVLLESMACGVPIIATRICDNERVIKEDEVGYLVTVGDETGMADRMKRLLGDTALRRDMGRRARAWVLDQFSSERLAEKMETVYQELLAEKYG